MACLRDVFISGILLVLPCTGYNQVTLHGYNLMVCIEHNLLHLVDAFLSLEALLIRYEIIMFKNFVTFCQHWLKGV